MFSDDRVVPRITQTVKNREGLMEFPKLMIDDRDLVRFGGKLTKFAQVDLLQAVCRR